MSIVGLLMEFLHQPYSEAFFMPLSEAIQYLNEYVERNTPEKGKKKNNRNLRLPPPPWEMNKKS